jgi:sugar lactone lactonase YvrE
MATTNGDYRAPRLISPARAEATVPPDFTGAWTPEDLSLDRVEMFRLPTGQAPEDVVVDGDGRLVAGGEDGTIWRWPVGATPDDVPEAVVNTGGRPLGVEIDPRDGTLIVCDAYRGLLRIDHDGALAVLTTHVGDSRILVCNNASVAADGVIYFSDSSSRYQLSDWKRDMLERRPNGRLLRHDPATGDTDVVLDELYFPNGVALSPDESTVMLAETSTHRVIRIPLDGRSPDVVTDLAAYPDNMSAVGDGTYWVALPSPRLPILEKLLPHPAVRRMVDVLPEAVKPKPARYGLVARIDGDGRVLQTLHGPTGVYCMITGVRQHDSMLWLGSLTEPGVARVSLCSSDG